MWQAAEHGNIQKLQFPGTYEGWVEWVWQWFTWFIYCFVTVVCLLLTHGQQAVSFLHVIYLLNMLYQLVFPVVWCKSTSRRWCRCYHSQNDSREVFPGRRCDPPLEPTRVETNASVPTKTLRYTLSHTTRNGDRSSVWTCGLSRRVPAAMGPVSYRKTSV